jgi:hypothetical protein
MNKSHFQTSLEAMQADHSRTLADSAEAKAKGDAETKEKHTEEVEALREETRAARRELEVGLASGMARRLEGRLEGMKLIS